jgi:hypothetical protein
MDRPHGKRLFPIVYSLPFLVAAGLSVLMLVTDKNLQTDFGTVTSGYFSHWYGVLAMTIADLAGAGILLAFRSRLAVKVGVLGSAAFALALVGVVFTYQQVGFQSAQQFAQYLFGDTYFGGDIRYLYDALLATYIGTSVSGAIGLALTRVARASREPVDSGAPTGI